MDTETTLNAPCWTHAAVIVFDGMGTKVLRATVVSLDLYSVQVLDNQLCVGLAENRSLTRFHYKYSRAPMPSGSSLSLAGHWCLDIAIWASCGLVDVSVGAYI